MITRRISRRHGDSSIAVSWLSVAWTALGAAGAGYAFVVSTKRLAVNTRLPGWVGEPDVIWTVGTLAAVAWLLLTIPVLIAGIARQLRDGRQLRAAAWAGAWAAGLALMGLVAFWQASPQGIDTCGHNGCALTGYRLTPASWPELLAAAAFLGLGVGMIRIASQRRQPKEA